jgi:hypothetical protein
MTQLTGFFGFHISAGLAKAIAETGEVPENVRGVLVHLCRVSSGKITVSAEPCGEAVALLESLANPGGLDEPR